jgi:hypothetical protein
MPTSSESSFSGPAHPHSLILPDEIIAMRFFIGRLIASSADVTERRKLLDLLHELSLAMLTLTCLVRTQLWFNKAEGSEIQNIIKQTIAETAKDWQ